MSRRLKYVMFSDAWWDEKRGGRRHRGRPRPLAARRFIFPKHCRFCAGPHWGVFGRSLFDTHVVLTVAPR